MTDELEKVERALDCMIGSCEQRIFAGDGDTTSLKAPSLASYREAKQALSALTEYRASLADADVVEVAAKHSYSRSLGQSWDDLNENIKDIWRTGARKTLSIITPLLRAKIEQDVRRDVVEEAAKIAWDYCRDAAPSLGPVIVAAIRALSPKQDREAIDG